MTTRYGYVLASQGHQPQELVKVGQAGPDAGECCGCCARRVRPRLREG